MRKNIGPITAAYLLLFFSLSFATPSTELWTAGTTDIQPYGVTHIGIDNYFTVFRKAADGAGGFPTDAGLTIGILPFSKVQMEIGIDLLEPLDYPVMGNAKLGVPEDGFFKGQPGLAAGIFNVGTKKDVTDYNIGYAAIGKTVPVIGRLFIGGYMGNKNVLGGNTDKGVTIAWDRSFLPAKGAGGADYSRILLCADLATGRNFYGGGGAGIALYFNENISILTGPIFFNDESLNGKWKWTTQLDINVKTW
ncbi:MAG: hypothetical protein ABSF80_06405 [Chitinispirillaceae bacterium]|jgi:hypothetical protein